MAIVTAHDVAYFNALVGRAGEAVAPERPAITFRDGASPRRNDCHANAARHASEENDAVPVHGWLIESSDGHHLGLAAHSLVRNNRGVLIDITPLDPFEPRFLAHNGSAEAFFALLPRFNTITWPPVDALATIVPTDGGAWPQRHL